MKNIFIIGSKGIPANYGGFETFVDKLTYFSKNEKIKYHVSCLADNEEEFEYNGARCFNVNVAQVGSARAILYDIKALEKCIEYIEKYNLYDSVIYILACRIGPFIHKYKRALNKMGVKIYTNPDGHEWKRSKWNYMVRKYWKISESLMVKHSDLLICDSKAIEYYINKEYKKYNPDTTYISYGAEMNPSNLGSNSKELKEWYKKYKINNNQYYLIVGRFVPENNYELVIREYMKSNTNKDLVIISNVEENKFYKKLLAETKFNEDKRIKFVGTVYNQELLKTIRENAYGYIHGHEVGGTNPSLLEALTSTKLNLLLDVSFNKEVGEDGAVYFTKEKDSLSNLIEYVDFMSEDNIRELDQKSKERISTNYTWEFIVKEYENLFLRR